MFDLKKAIKEVCEEKQVKESQFNEYLSVFGKYMVEREVERFIDYCEADGWHYWHTQYKPIEKSVEGEKV